MTRIRAVGIVVKDDEVLIMHRKNTKEYFTFPGGGVEPDETVERAVIRELAEETSIEALIKKLLYHIIYDDNTEHYFYLCEYLSGTPSLAKDSEEIKTMSEGKEFYNPVWTKANDLKSIILYPIEVRDWLIEDLNNGFVNPVREISMRVSDRKQS